MIGKWYFSKFEKDKITYFSAESPEKIMAILNFQEKEILTKKNILDKITPSLNKLSNSQKPLYPIIKYFEWKKAVQQIYEEWLLQPNYSIWNPEKVSPHFSESFFETLFKGKWWKQDQLELMPNSEFNKNFINKRKVKNIETKFFTKTNISFSTDNFIYGNKFANISFSEDWIFWMIIEWKDFSDTQRVMFMNLWEYL